MLERQGARRRPHGGGPLQEEWGAGFVVFSIGLQKERVTVPLDFGIPFQPSAKPPVD